jgi:hypothetical protein
MAIKLKHSDSYSTYFITFTCVEWISLFEVTKGYDLAYNWFAVLNKYDKADFLSGVLLSQRGFHFLSYNTFSAGFSFPFLH